MASNDFELSDLPTAQNAPPTSVEEVRRRNARIAWIAFFAILLITIAIKIVYMMTAESTADAEEIPLSAVDLVSGGAGAFDIESTRLYGFNFITTAISLFFFGYRVVALKLPGLGFFIASTVFLFLLGRRIFQDRPWHYQVLPAALIALGPPVAQMWALKNRGGFIETWAILAVLLWLYDVWRSRGRPKHLIMAMGILMGLAVWAQPIAMCFVLPLGCAILLELSRDGWQRGGISFGWLAATALVGVLPLLAINFLHDMRSFSYVTGGEDSSYFSSFTFAQRLHAIFDMGIPCLLGLKQQWYPHWILPRALSLALYLILVLPLFLGFAAVVRQAWRSRIATAGCACAGVVLVVMMANVATSFGSFQMEPRRLLLLYVPCAVLVTMGLVGRSRRLLALYLVCFAAVSVASNVDYVKTNLHGFQHPAYDNYHDLTALLQQHGITGVYSGIMIGAKVSFESHGAIQTFWQPYRYGPYGYISEGDFDEHDAILFPAYEQNSQPQRARLRADLDTAGIRCHEFGVHDIDVFLACSRRFNIRDLSDEADQIRVFAKKSEIFSNADYAHDVFDDLFLRERAFTWTRPRARIPFFVDQESASGKLIIDLAAYRALAPDSLRITVDDEPVGTHIAQQADGSYKVVSDAALEMKHGHHVLGILASPFMPSDGGSKDPRALGVPLISAVLRQ